MKPVRKAVIPVAGLGTRFLPATKALPKEMLTVVDRPVVQMVVDEARAAGIENFVFVTGRNKSLIEDHFDKQYELESTLRKRGKSAELERLANEMVDAGETFFTRQQQPLGLGHAIWCARNFIGHDPFAVLLPDMIMQARPGCLKQMMDAYAETGPCNVVAVEEVPWDKVHSYGVVAPKNWQGNRFDVDAMIEKPPKGTAPSNLIISGRYILQPEIFDFIESPKVGSTKEIQITDAMSRLLGTQRFVGLRYEGETFDCGNRLGFLSANVAFALENDLISDQFKASLTHLIKKHGGSCTW
jgi:UTP--glucose-1-phosphate uridylyltransferase